MVLRVCQQKKVTWRMERTTKSTQKYNKSMYSYNLGGVRTNEQGNRKQSQNRYPVRTFVNVNITAGEGRKSRPLSTRRGSHRQCRQYNTLLLTSQ